MANTFDPGVLAEIQKHSQELEAQFGARNTMFDEIEKIFLCDWTGKPSDPNVKITISPDGRNSAVGAIRLVTAAEPSFSVPYDKNSVDGQKKSSAIEKASAALWYLTGRIRQSPIHYDLVRSGVLFGEVAGGVMDTAQLLEQAKGSSKAAQMRAEQVAAMTPYLLTIYDPRTCFPEYDDLGLTAFFRKVTVKSGKILDEWGQAALDAGLNPGMRFTDRVLCEYWDMQYHVVWLQGGQALMGVEHGLPVIPVFSYLVDGSLLHKKPEQQRQPFLYTLWKTGMWERQNLALSVMFTSLFRYGNSPMIARTSPTPDEAMLVDWDSGTANLRTGETLQQLAINPINPAITQGLETAERKGTESTIYKQALGEPLGNNAPYSMVSLLNQAGRLPLVPVQKMCSAAIGKATEIVFALWKTGGGKRSVQGKGGDVLSLSATDIPDNLIVESKLEIDMPTDDRQNAVVSAQLNALGFPMRWIAENFWHIGQWDDLQQERFNEMATTAQLQAQLQLELQKLQAQNTPQQPVGPGQLQPGMPQQPGQGMPPEQGAFMPPQPQPGQGGMPPELMQGGPNVGLPAAGPLDQAQGAGG